MKEEYFIFSVIIGIIIIPSCYPLEKMQIGNVTFEIDSDNEKMNYYWCDVDDNNSLVTMSTSEQKGSGAAIHKGKSRPLPCTMNANTTGGTTANNSEIKTFKANISSMLKEAIFP